MGPSACNDCIGTVLAVSFIRLKEHDLGCASQGGLRNQMVEQGSVYKKSASGGTPPPLHLPNKVMFVIKRSTPDPGAHLAEVISSPYATPEGGNPPLDYPYSLLLPSNSYINAK